MTLHVFYVVALPTNRKAIGFYIEALDVAGR